MANFKTVNAVVSAVWPNIEVVRGVGYVYFSGDDGFDKIPSLYIHPTTTSTEDMVRHVCEQIKGAE